MKSKVEQTSSSLIGKFRLIAHIKGVEKGKQIAKETIVERELKTVRANNCCSRTSSECIIGPLYLPPQILNLF